MLKSITKIGLIILVLGTLSTGIGWQKSGSSGISKAQVFPPVGYILALKTDGTLWGWGNNNAGQLGDGTSASYIIGGSHHWVKGPFGCKRDTGNYGMMEGTFVYNGKTVPGKIGTDTNWLTISTYYSHTAALKTDGTLWAWGNNYDGQLGDNRTSDRKTIPTKIGLDTNWSTIAVGWPYTMALKTNGTLWAWGDNGFGQLGDGTKTDKYVPTQITGSNWACIAVGTYHSHAIKTDGTLWSWGWNKYGQLGDGTYVDKNTPAQISGSNWSTITAGGAHCLALKTDGTLWAWGDNSFGQLGDGTIISCTIPTQITGTNWSAIETCKTDWNWLNGYTAALKTDGTLWVWGSSYGNTPVQIGADTDWSAVTVGSDHIVALKTNGTLWGWGNNQAGQLGMPGASFSDPTRIGTDSNWSKITAGAGSDYYSSD